MEIDKNNWGKRYPLPQDKMLDSLTQMGNNNYTRELQQAAIRDNETIVMWDIDNFKAINEIFGYDEADKVIQKISKLANEHFKDVPHGRKGGEEFIAVTNDIAIVNAFLHDVGRNVKINDQPVTISIGMGDGYGYDEHGAKRGVAEIAMKQAKEMGKNQLLSYSGGEFEQNPGYPVSDKEKLYVGEFSVNEGINRLKSVMHVFGGEKSIVSQEVLEKIEQGIKGLEEIKIQMQKGVENGKEKDSLEGQSENRSVSEDQRRVGEFKNSSGRNIGTGRTGIGDTTATISDGSGKMGNEKEINEIVAGLVNYAGAKHITVPEKTQERWRELIEKGESERSVRHYIDEYSKGINGPEEQNKDYQTKKQVEHKQKETGIDL